MVQLHSVVGINKCMHGWKQGMKLVFQPRADQMVVVQITVENPERYVCEYVHEESMHTLALYICMAC